MDETAFHDHKIMLETKEANEFRELSETSCQGTVCSYKNNFLLVYLMESVQMELLLFDGNEESS